MKLRPATAVILGALVWAGMGVFGADQPHDLKRDGAFAFPQSKAEVLRDQKDLRLSVWYVVGTGSDLAPEYGVTGIPHAFLIGKDGKLLWEGNPADKEFDQRIVAALKANP